MAMTAESKGKNLCIASDIKKSAPSSFSKTLAVASILGNVVTTDEVDGRSAIVGLNTYINS